jgi:UDP-N-acetylglucosamine 2-epimerase (non-hydrolysing)
MKVLSIFGTRPEAIKMAPVIRELEGRPDRFRSIVCVTAQHRQMLDQVLEIFRIKPHIDLDLMEENQTLPGFAGRALAALSGVVAEVRPHWILVQGDTTTTMMAALAGFYNGVKVGHIEAGLRTGDKTAPYPEEINRRVTSVLADYHFPPTERARQALLREGVPADRIAVTGNTVIDALFMALNEIRTGDLESGFRDLFAGLLPGLFLQSPVTSHQSPVSSPLPSTAAPSHRGSAPASGPLLSTTIDHPPSTDFILVTGHRRESFGEPFEEICLALRDLADAFPDLNIVYPVHLNPNVRKPVYRILGNNDRVHLIEPLAYLPFLWLMSRARLILTDSGGIQEEAPSLGIPVLVMREVTERPEGVEAGCSALVGAGRDRIVEGASRLLTDEATYSRMARAQNPYGDGLAASRIVSALEA